MMYEWEIRWCMIIPSVSAHLANTWKCALSTWEDNSRVSLYLATIHNCEVQQHTLQPPLPWPPTPQSVLLMVLLSPCPSPACSTHILKHVPLTDQSMDSFQYCINKMIKLIPCFSQNSWSWWQTLNVRLQKLCDEMAVNWTSIKIPELGWRT